MSEIKSGATKPGTIICDTILESYRAAIRPWGIILPKNNFVFFYTSEKGHWPKGRSYSTEFIKHYGNALPVVSGTDLIASSEEFISDNRYIGVKWFGNIYSSVLDRELGFEVVKSNLSPRHRTYSISKLGEILETRGIQYDFMRDGDKRLFYKSITSDMLTAQKYFSGEYKDIDVLHIIENESSSASKLVGVLRACFPEENLFGKNNK